MDVKLKLLDLNLITGGFQNFPWINKLCPLEISGRGGDVVTVFPATTHCDITDHAKTREDCRYANQLRGGLLKIP